MHRLSLQACLKTRWQQSTHAACLLAPLATAGRASGTGLGPSTAIQTRRLHHQHHRTRSTPARTRRHSPLYCSLNTALPPTTATTVKPNTRGYSATAPPEPAPGPEPTIHPVFEPQTSTWQYLVADPTTHTAVIIDPVLDYNNSTRTVSTHSADALLSLVRANGYTVSHILETHAHADHLTAAFYLQRRLTAQQGGVKPPVGIGKRIGQVQSLFGKRYGIDSGEYDGVFDLLLEDDGVFSVGELEGRVVHLPGHTPDHVGYWIGANVFCGDSLFHPSLGTARCDFPGGSAQALYQSARKLLALPDHVKVWTGHDYPVEGEREPEPWTSVGEHRAKNKHIRDGVTEGEFVEIRSERDKQLDAPRLVHESLQVNIRGGQLPKADEAGIRTFKLPLKVKGDGW